MIDTHAHLIASDRVRYPLQALGGERAGAPPVLERAVDGPQLLALMDQAGVERTVLVHFAHVHGYDASYVVDVANEHPERFSSVCCFDGLAPDAAQQLEYWANRGAAGVRLVAPTRDSDASFVRSDAVWRRAPELGMVLKVHFTVPLHESGLPVFEDMLRAHPNTTVVLDHLSNPPWNPDSADLGMSRLLVLAGYPNLHLMFSTINFNRMAAAGVQAHTALRLLIDCFGAQRLMWGSDIPNSAGDYSDMVARFKAATGDLSDNERGWLNDGTAARLFKWR